jgi:hypothetical protein
MFGACIKTPHLIHHTNHDTGKDTVLNGTACVSSTGMSTVLKDDSNDPMMIREADV